jgi:hypothetical protein
MIERMCIVIFIEWFLRISHAKTAWLVSLLSTFLLILTVASFPIKKEFLTRTIKTRTDFLRKVWSTFTIDH